MLSVVNAVLPLRSRLPLHQSQDALPAWIHDVSWICDSGLRLVTTFDSTSFEGSVATWITRHAEWCGSGPTTAVSGSSRCGAITEWNQWTSQLPSPLVRYMAALSLRSASVMATQATPDTCINSGSPIS